MKRKNPELQDMEEKDSKGEELDPKELKKKEREEKKEKRLKRKKQDKAARWAGTIMLFLIMIAGFLLWVSGQLSQGSTGEYVRPVTSPSERVQPPLRENQSPSGKVIIK